MRDEKGIRNSKFEMRKLEIGRKCSREVRKGRGRLFDIMQNVEMKWVTPNLS
jgi:hypothetical protein